MYRIRYNSIVKKYEFDKQNFDKWETNLKGNLEQISNYALNFIELDELIFAYEIMDKNKHTVAEFGIMGRFIFSH